jgi:hypothetical protein
MALESLPTGLRHHPPKAIRDLDELKTITALSLSLHIWDIDTKKIDEFWPTSLAVTRRGLVLNYTKGVPGHYIRWFNIEDPTYDEANVTLNMDDRRFQAFYFGMYAFNNYEDAHSAYIAHEQQRQIERKNRELMREAAQRTRNPKG